MQDSCDHMLPCGHPCRGVKNETEHLPCLEPGCIEKMEAKNKLNVTKEDYCPICYCSGLGNEPSVRLDCGHVMHYHCIKT